MDSDDNETSFSIGVTSDDDVSILDSDGTQYILTPHQAEQIAHALLRAVAVANAGKRPMAQA